MYIAALGNNCGGISSIMWRNTIRYSILREATSCLSNIAKVFVVSSQYWWLLPRVQMVLQQNILHSNDGIPPQYLWYPSTVLIVSPQYWLYPSTVLMVYLHSIDGIPPVLIVSLHSIDCISHSTDCIPPQYWWYRSPVLMLSSVTLNTLQCTYGIPHSTEHPAQYWTPCTVLYRPT